MRRRSTLLATLLVAFAALSGCALGGDDETPTPTPTPTEEPTVTPPATTPTATPTPTPPTTSPPLDSSSYQIATAGVPGQAKVGARWSFTLFVNGSATRASDHIGAHYADNDTTNPPGTGRRDCEHVAGDLPGVFTVSCTTHDAGTWYLWGHARINDSGELRNWWSATPDIVKVRDFNLTLTGAPTAPVGSNATFRFQVASAGTENVTTDHFGAHFWNATQADPTLENAAGICEHIAAGSVGNYTISCAIVNRDPLPHEFFLRGHLRIVEGGTTLHWWSAETKVTVLGNPLV